MFVPDDVPEKLVAVIVPEKVAVVLFSTNQFSSIGAVDEDNSGAPVSTSVLPRAITLSLIKAVP